METYLEHSANITHEDTIWSIPGERQGYLSGTHAWLNRWQWPGMPHLRVVNWVSTSLCTGQPIRLTILGST